MARVWYLSRATGRHDQRWTSVLSEAGHTVTAWHLADGVTAELLRRRAAGAAPDLVVAGPLSDALPVAIEADVAPTLAMCWGFDVLLETDDPDVGAAVRRALPRAAGVHVDCADMARRTAALGADPAGISVAPWGIDVELFSPGPAVPGLRERAGFNAEDVVVLSTRAWEPPYGVDVLLEGFARARSRDPRLVLAWGGSGSLAPALRGQVAALDLGGAVVELGVLPPVALRDWLRSSDVYASAAHSDGSSLSLLEALACGVPAVVTDLPSNREWVTDEVRGRVFRDGDPEALAAALVAVAAGPSAADAVARRRAVVLDQGDWRRNRAVFSAAVDRAMAGAA
ncbi:glycosyltransferase [Modestobacter sp. SYSU DS0875]